MNRSKRSHTHQGAPAGCDRGSHPVRVEAAAVWSRRLILSKRGDSRSEAAGSASIFQ